MAGSSVTTRDLDAGWLLPSATLCTGTYAVTCDSQALDAGGCEGLPNDIWGRCSLRRCEAKVSYPEGCTVWLPTENPYYPGSAQNCTCMPLGSSHELRWGCGL